MLAHGFVPDAFMTTAIIQSFQFKKKQQQQKKQKNKQLQKDDNGDSNANIFELRIIQNYGCTFCYKR